MKWLCALVLGASLGACVVTPAPAGDTLYDDGDQGAPGCPIPATYQGQPGVPGDPCSDANLDCSPACCSCPSGLDSYWASECSAGICTDDATACADAFNSDPSLCPNG